MGNMLQSLQAGCSFPFNQAAFKGFFCKLLLYVFHIPFGKESFQERGFIITEVDKESLHDVQTKALALTQLHCRYQPRFPGASSLPHES